MKLRLSDTLNSLMLGGLLMASTFASAGNKPTKPYWQDVQVVAVNKEYPRSSFMTYENRANALTGKFEKASYYQLLNGTWKFYFVDSYKNLPANITDPCNQYGRLGRHQSTGQLGSTRPRSSYLYQPRI